MKFLPAIIISFVFSLVAIKVYPFQIKLVKYSCTIFPYMNNTVLFCMPVSDELRKIGDSLTDSAKDISNNNVGESLDSEKVGERNISVPKWYNMVTNLPSDMVKFYHKDIRIEKIPIFLGISAATAGLILLDNNIWRASDRFYNQSQFNKNLSDLFVNFGDGKFQFVVAGAFAIYGWMSTDKLALTTASEVVEAVLATGAVVQLLKHITGRQSPYVSSKPGGVWDFFPNQIQYHKHVPFYDAFPSGHLSTLLAAFTVIANNYSGIKWIRPVSYTIEAMLSISMVNQGIHWYSDYPLAIFLGYEFGNIISQKNNNSTSGKNGITQLNIFPFISPVGTGVEMRYDF